MDDGMDACVLVTLIIVGTVAVVKTEDHVCDRPKQTGPCRALIKRYFYHKRSGKCREFGWGGCGEGNVFESEAECQQKCIGCREPAQRGSCRAAHIRWYHENGICKTFLYGGCDPNSNNFLKEKDCYNACT